MSDTAKVWIGCLACYNNGRLTGEWHDALGAGEVTTEQLHADAGVTVDPRYGPHEELWCMDHEGFYGALTGECSPVEAQTIAETLESVDDDKREGFGAYLSNVQGVTSTYTLDDAVSDFEDHYEGRWDSFCDYVEEFIDSTGMLDKIPDDLASYFDTAAYARDMEQGYSVVEAEGPGVHIFRD